MRPRPVLFTILFALTWSMLSLVITPGAWACSCAAPPPTVAFEGTVTAESGQSDLFERAYGFAVDRVISGEVHQPSETVRISLTGANGGGSSCGIVQRLQNGGRYRIEAYQGELEGEKLLFANSCGGSVALLPAAATEDESDPGRWGLVIVPVLAVGAAAGFIPRRRSRP